MDSWLHGRNQQGVITTVSLRRISLKCSGQKLWTITSAGSGRCSQDRQLEVHKSPALVLSGLRTTWLLHRWMWTWEEQEPQASGSPHTFLHVHVRGAGAGEWVDLGCTQAQLLPSSVSDTTHFPGGEGVEAEGRTRLSGTVLMSADTEEASSLPITAVQSDSEAPPTPLTQSGSG